LLIRSDPTLSRDLIHELPKAKIETERLSFPILVYQAQSFFDRGRSILVRFDHLNLNYGLD